MAIEFWLSYNNGAEKLRLPVHPESLAVSSPFSNADINVVQLGQFTVIGDRGLKEFSFSSFFPRDYNPTYCEYANFPTPRECLETIERWRDTRRPIRFIVTNTAVNYAVTVRDFSYEVERAGSPGDIYFSLSLSEFQFLHLRQEIDVTKKTPATSNRPPVINKGTSTAKSATYVVKSGDSLSKIAGRKEVLGSANDWRKIYDANKKTIGANPNVLKIGTKLVIPR